MLQCGEMVGKCFPTSLSPAQTEAQARGSNSLSIAPATTTTPATS